MPNRIPFRFDPGISLGHVISALPTVVLAVWILSGNAKQVDTTQKQLDQYKAEITAQIAMLKSEQGTQIAGIKSDLTLQIATLKSEQVAQIAQMQLNTDKQFSSLGIIIANLPGMKERVDQLDKRMDQSDSRFDAQSKRLESVQSQSVENTTNLNNMARILGTSPRNGR